MGCGFSFVLVFQRVCLSMSWFFLLLIIVRCLFFCCGSLGGLLCDFIVWHVSCTFLGNMMHAILFDGYTF